MANKISALLPETYPGPSSLEEAKAQITYKDKIADFLKQLSELVDDAQRIFTPNPLSPVISPPPSNQITIATSIAATKDIAIQKRCIDSWILAGFKVVAVNTQEEMNMIKHYFPSVEFVIAKRDARAQFGKPYIYMDDILSYFTAQSNKICGIVNSDIYFGQKNLPLFMSQQALNSLVFGSRVDVTSFENTSNGKFYNGFDYFFFDKDFLKLYPPSNFCIGLPWWDYWMPLIAILSHKPVKKVTSPICYHMIHPTNYSMAIYNSLALQMANHLSLGPQPSDLHIARLQQMILGFIENSSANIEFRIN